jgi:uncharacterized protein
VIAAALKPEMGETIVLDLRPNCECCDKDLPPDAADAMICSFECTFCRNCAETALGGLCPNCGGELLTRPTRPAEKLARFPASRTRVLKPDGCVGLRT